jgi:hypothetical protein
VEDPDRSARRGWLLALASVPAVPVLILLVVVVPQGWRLAIYLTGLFAIAGVAIWGGLLARRGLVGGTSLTVRAIAGMWLGLTLGVTATVFTLWTLVGLAF